MRVLAAIFAYVAGAAVYMTAWYYLFGYPVHGMKYLALGVGLALTRVGVHLFNRVYPGDRGVGL